MKLTLLVMFITFPILAYIFWPGAESKIKKLVHETAQAAEAGDVEAMMANVSYNYHDDKGMSYLYLSKILQRELKRLSDVKVEIVSLKVRIIGKKAYATVAMRVLATFPDGARGYFLGDMDAPFIAEIQVRNEKPMGWKVISGKYGYAQARSPLLSPSPLMLALTVTTPLR